MGSTKAARGRESRCPTGQDEKTGRKEISAKRGRCRLKQKRQRHSGDVQGAWGNSLLCPEGKQQESAGPGEERAASAQVAPLMERKVRSRTAKAMGRRLSVYMRKKIYCVLMPLSIKEERLPPEELGGIRGANLYP